MRRPPLSRWLAAMHNFDQANLPRTAQVTRWLTHWLGHHPSPRVRFTCAYFSLYGEGTRLLSALVDRAADPREHPSVRGECLQWMHPSWRRPRSRADRRAHRVILQCLRDPHPRVRFWACYKVADLRLQRGRAGLRALLQDEAVGDMGWTVGYEAGEALKALRGEEAWDDDKPAFAEPFDLQWK